MERKQRDKKNRYETWKPLKVDTLVHLLPDTAAPVQVIFGANYISFSCGQTHSDYLGKLFSPGEHDRTLSNRFFAVHPPIDHPTLIR